MTGFSTAADWLGNITGTPKVDLEKKDEHNDPILRDLREMKDNETLATEPKVPRYASKGVNTGPRYVNQLNQPKPKFVAHKEPKSSGKKGNAAQASNRLGGNHMA
jgi:hypothetical protein